MNCGNVKQLTMSTYGFLDSQGLASEMSRRGYPYPNEVMHSPFSEQQKKSALLNMFGEYEQSRCNQMRGQGYSLYGGKKRRPIKKRQSRKSRKIKKSRRTRRNN